MKAVDIAYLASLVTVITFVSDRYANRKRRRKAAMIEPASVDSIVLANARSAVELQSTVSAQLRNELDIRDRVIRDQAAQIAEHNIEKAKAEQREANLLRRIGELDREVELLRKGGAGKEVA